MCHIIVIGAGITGVTTAYELSLLGYQVTVVDKHLYPAMETSFANGGQLSACNAEVWNQKATVLNGIKWMSQKSAPLLLNPSFSMHKYAWLLEFMGNIKHYKANSQETVRMALLARQRLFEIAEKEKIEFNLEKRGILHFYHNKVEYDTAIKVNEMLCEGGLERYAVTNQEMQSIEPSLRGSYYGGFYCPGDATGDIHKFTMGLAETTQRLGVKYLFGMDASAIHLNEQGVRVLLKPSDENMEKPANTIEILNADALVICGGVGSYHLAEMLGDRVNIYPVKGYSITVELKDSTSQQHAPWVSLLDESAKIVSSRLGIDRLRVAGTAEFNGYNRDIRSDRIQPLIDWLHRNFDLSTEFAIPWAGLRPMMPIVNRGKRERVFYNTGHGHLGWTLSAATAVMISQQIAQSHPI
ncbi:D-amino acid dehydrogenase [Acinetobacter celticus]|uniref:D-amino acid dehydrogenase n=1 Tax=Acinetobacter celticus TaxID=1891224 RepID=A0A1C3CTI4_9GAMM|nr:D-amino acid dehydrogenase [Acinetobacter celticus]ODA12052.1 D-amino acid dehydrogenase [Acinetobacter celticus]